MGLIRFVFCIVHLTMDPGVPGRIVSMQDLVVVDIEGFVVKCHFECCGNGCRRF